MACRRLSATEKYFRGIFTANPNYLKNLMMRGGCGLGGGEQASGDFFYQLAGQQ